MALLHGKCQVLFAFDLGQSIDLEHGARQLRGARRTAGLEPVHHAPSWFQFEPAPVRAHEPHAPIEVGRWRSTGEVVLTVFEFGAVSVTYEIELTSELAEWIELCCALSTSAALEQAARARVQALFGELGSSIARPELAPVCEDYVVFRFGNLAPGTSADELLLRDGLDLARMLRAERGVLSAQEVGDALSTRVSYHESDLTLIDWHAAVVFDDDPDDVLRVLEFANVQLLELRFLDTQLDRSLDRAYELLARRDWRRRLAMFGLHRDLDRVSAMQVDGAILFERVGNTLKLVSDQYLARVLRQTSQRFRTPEWNAGILRKLDTLDDIYEKIHDHAAALRAEFLEWIIIVLIAFEIVWAWVS